MLNRNPFSSIRSLRYRPRFLGWLVSSVLLVLLTHLILLLSLIMMGVGLIQPYIGMGLWVLSFVSVGVFAHFLVRMLAPAESPRQALESNRSLVAKSLLGGILLLQIVGVVSRYFLSISPSDLHPVAPLIAVLFYSAAIVAGYDGARSKNAIEQARRKRARDNDEFESIPLFSIFTGRSRRKALGAVFGCLVIGSVVGLFRSPIAGLSTAGSIATLLALLVQLYPDEE